ncbi:unnamed protein product [Absidia cylindrospora]
MTMKPYLTDNNNVIPSHHPHRHVQQSSSYNIAKQSNSHHSQDDDEDDEDNALHLFQQRIKRGRCKSPQHRSNNSKTKKKRSWLSSDDDDDDDNYGKQLGDQSFSTKKQPQQSLSSPGSPTEKRKRGRPRKDGGADESYSSPRRFSSSTETPTRDQSNGHSKLSRKCKSNQKRRIHEQTRVSSTSLSTGRMNKIPTVEMELSDTETTKNDRNMTHTSPPIANSLHTENPPLTPSSPSTKSRPSSLTDPNRADKAGRTKLFTFTSSGHLDKIKELVAQGANVNFKDHAGWVPLHEAALKGQCDIASYFIDCGADVNVRGYGDDTPLHDACSSGHADIVQLLINSGADVFALNSDKQQPIDVCDNEACERIIQAKMKQLDRLVARDSTGRTTLHRMCAEGRYDDVASLVKQGANVNAEDSKQWTPLHEAAKHGHLKIVRLLVQHGADINHSGYQGSSVLHSACRSGHDKVVHFLMDQGANIHAKTDAGKTVYQVTTSASIRRDLAATIDDERKQRATSDAIDEITFTALRQRKLSSKSSTTTSSSSSSLSRNAPLSREERKIQAIMKSFEALEQQQPRQHQPPRSSRASRRRDTTPTTTDAMATKKGCDDADEDNNEHQIQNDVDEMNEDEQIVVEATNSGEQRKKRPRRSNKTSMGTRTRSLSREPMEDTLVDSAHSTNKDQSAVTATTTKKKLDPTKLNPHKKDTSGRTHLHRWAIRGDVNVVKVLLQAGADPNVTDHAGYTPLHESSLRDRGDVVRLLLENGANVDAKGVDLDTALHDAVDNGHPKVVDILLQFGADPHIRNSKGMTPLEMAKEHDHFEIQSLLKQAIGNGKKKTKNDPELVTATHEEKHQHVKKQTKKRRLVLAADLEQASSLSSSSSLTSPVRQRSPTLDLFNIKTEPPSRTINPMDIHMLTEETPPSSQPTSSSPSNGMKSRKKEPAAHQLSSIDGPHTPIPTPYVERWLAKRVKEEIKVGDEPLASCALASVPSGGDIEPNTLNATTTIKPDTEMNTSTTSPPPSPPRSRTLSEAMRYLPLYTVQLVEEDGIQSSLYVLDLQIGLLLNLSTDALWHRYPNLRRRQVTLKEKERLWSPLASMVCAGAGASTQMKLACMDQQETSSLSSSSSSLYNDDDNDDDRNSKKHIATRFRDQEKQRFLDMTLYFVHLDPVVTLIKHDYDYLSKNLITITLDIGYQQDQPQQSIHSTTTTPPSAAVTPPPPPHHHYSNDLLSSSTYVSKTPLKKRLPPKFAMKMQRQAIHNTANKSNSTPPSPH